MKLNELNKNYETIMNLDIKAKSIVEKINKNSDLYEFMIRHNGASVVIYDVEKVLKIMKDADDMNYKLIKTIGLLFKENIRTNDSTILNTVTNVAISIKSTEDMHFKLVKTLRDIETNLDELSKERNFVNFVRDKFYSSVLYYIDVYIKAIKTLTEAYNICANKILKSKSNNTKTTTTIQINNKPNDKWQTINKHGFSFNRMYVSAQNRLVRSSEYNAWINEMLCAMKNHNIKSLRSIGVNPHKPMKLDVEFKLVRGSDTDNPLKSFIDLLVRYYGLTDDNNFVDIHISRNPVWANSYSDGQIKFKITNI
jgi:Holliday junction resolvase RusA-like endonuclease